MRRTYANSCLMASWLASWMARRPLGFPSRSALCSLAVLVFLLSSLLAALVFLAVHLWYRLRFWHRPDFWIFESASFFDFCINLILGFWQEDEARSNLILQNHKSGRISVVIGAPGGGPPIRYTPMLLPGCHMALPRPQAPHMAASHLLKCPNQAVRKLCPGNLKQLFGNVLRANIKVLESMWAWRDQNNKQLMFFQAAQGLKMGLP